MPKLDLNFNRDESLARAACGDFGMLASRLRASGDPELEFAADIIEGVRKRPKHRPRENFERDLKIFDFVEDRMFGSNGVDGISRDAAVVAAAEKFVLGKSTIDGILRDMEASAAGKPRPRRTKRVTRVG
jgi:hypothetical protein